MSGFYDFIFGKKSKMKPFNKKSLQYLESLLGGEGGLDQSPLYQSGSNFLQNILSGDPQAYAAFERPLMENFEQNIVPQIAERFAGMGTGAGASSSSALYNSLAQAGRGLQGDIGTLRAGLGMQAAQQGLGYANAPIQNRLTAALGLPNQYYERPGQGGFIHGVLNSAAETLGSGQALGGQHAIGGAL